MGLFDFCLLFAIPFAFLVAVASEETRIRFPDFATEDHFMAVGDAAHRPANRSYITNAGATLSRGSCGVLMYKKKVRIQDVATGRAASFSSSFSFIFTTHGVPWDYNRNPADSIGFTFAFMKSSTLAMQDFGSEVARAGACDSYRFSPNLKYHIPGFSVVIATGFIPSRNIHSDNIIKIYRNLENEYDMSAYSHNLCGNDTHCSYFPNGRVFTAWVDFNSSSHTLEVRLANGSNPGVTKPLQPLLLIPRYKMAQALDDDVYLSFWGSSAVGHVQTHELLSWNFFSSGIPESNVRSHTKSLLHFQKPRTWVAITVVVFGTKSVLLILWLIARFVRPSRYHRYTTLDYATGPHVFTYDELKKATENFDERNLLGAGGSGSVYKGCLEGASGSGFFAVKQINFSESKQAESLFHAEVASLGQIRHRNVVQLQGWCREKGRLLLVYDYMSNGGLDEWLHRSGSHFQEQVLSLTMRHSILEGVAAALEYLHEDCHSCILHRDIKSSNVLLDVEFKAHLGDFGLARLMDHHKLNKTTLAAGTLGYIAPELPYTGRATKESDVYSFGILVLEVVCGKQPLDLETCDLDDPMLLHIVWQAHEGGSLMSVVDPRLLHSLQPLRSVPREGDESLHAVKPPPSPANSHNNLIENTVSESAVVDVDIDIGGDKAMVVNLLHLGLLCCLPNPKARPSMGQVNGLLQQVREMKNIATVTTIPMPSLPTNKPLGLYHTLDFLKVVINSSSSTSPFASSPYAKSFLASATLQQELENGLKDD